MPAIDIQTVEQHEQKYNLSCIPSSIELILKLLNRVPNDYYELQDAWNNKGDGSFADFNNKVIEGIQFQEHFHLPRNDQFPLEDLFAAIDHELENERFVVVSLPVSIAVCLPKSELVCMSKPLGYHMFVVYSKGKEGSYEAVSKWWTMTWLLSNVKQHIANAEGSDILVYREVEG